MRGVTGLFEPAQNRLRTASGKRIMSYLHWSFRNSAQEVEEANRTEEMGRKTARGGVLGVGASFTKAIIQLVITALLSRILDIDDYGVAAMSGTVLAFFGMFSDLGMGGAIVQRQTVDQRLLSNLFWISSAVGVGLFLIICALSPLVAMFYHDSRLIGLVAFAGLGIPLASLSSAHQAMMARQARWVELNGLFVVSQILAGVIAVLAALYLAIGYWALALQGVLGGFFVLIALWTVCRWRPSGPRNLREARHAVHFGGFLMAFNFVNYAHRQMDNLIVGRTLGAAELGLYSRGYNLFMLPLTMVVWPMAGVVTPLLARQQDEPDRFAATYYGALAAVYVITAPLAGGLFLFAEESVTLLYGAKWVEVSGVLSILAIALLWQPAYSSGGWIELSLGRSKRHFYAISVAAPAYLAAFLIGVQDGILGMAKAYLVANVVIVGPWLWFTSMRTKITLAGILRATRGSLLAMGAAVAVIWALTPYVHVPGGWIVDFFVRAALFGLVYLLVLLVCWRFDRGWSDIITPALNKLMPASTVSFRKAIWMAGHPRAAYRELKMVREIAAMEPVFDGKPWFEKADIIAVKALLDPRKSVVEYGSGSSTAYFAARSCSVHSVDSSDSYVAAVTAETRRRGLTNVQIAVADLGPVGEWGWPIDQYPTDGNIARWRRYLAAPWETLGDAPVSVVVIDGRFRAACAAYAVARLLDRGDTGAVVFLDDFVGREDAYGCLEEIAELVRTPGRGVIVKPKSADSGPVYAFVDRLIIDLR